MQECWTSVNIWQS